MSDPGEKDGAATSRLRVEYALLLELSQAIGTTLDLAVLVQVISDGTARLLGVETTALYLVEDSDLVLAATTPPLDPGMPDTLRRMRCEDHPHIAKVIETLQPVVLEDMSQAELSPAERAVVEQRGLRSLLFLPFGRDGLPVGVLILGTKSEQRRFGEHEIELGLALANQLALAVQNARLHASLKGYTTTLEQQITEQKRLEERLLQAQRMEAMGQIAGGMAHDFNNYLQIIAGYSDMAQSYLPASSDTYQSLALILQAVGRASGLVRGLLAFARRQPLSLRVVDVNQTVEGLLPMLRPLLTERVIVEARFGVRPANVRADPTQLEQILINLCVNARDAMPEGGALTISTTLVPPHEPVPSGVSLPGPGPYVRIAVTDTGQGMDPETCRRAFEPFFTTKEPGAGNGLGLSMVHGLVAQHGGVSHIVTAPNQGTTIELYLPLVPEESTTVAQTPVASDGGTETILFAEDNRMVRDLTLKLLSSVGYSVIVASDGQEAVNLLTQHAQRIDLALLDLVMPHLGGEEVCRALHSLRPEVPVIFASGQGGGGISDPALANSVDVLQKPYRRDELLNKIRRALSKSKRS